MMPLWPPLAWSILHPTQPVPFEVWMRFHFALLQEQSYDLPCVV